MSLALDNVVNNSTRLNISNYHIPIIIFTIIIKINICITIRPSKTSLFCLFDFILMGGSRGDRGSGSPPEKSQKYRVSSQYCYGSPEES